MKQIQHLKYLNSLLNEELMEIRYGLHFHDAALSTTSSNFAVKSNKLLEILPDEYKNSHELKTKYVQFSDTVSRKIQLSQDLTRNIRITKNMQQSFTNKGLKLLNELESTNIDPSLSLLVVRIINYTITYNLDADPQIKQQAKNHINLLQSSNPSTNKYFQAKLTEFINNAYDTLLQFDNVEQKFTEFLLTPTSKNLDLMAAVYIHQHEQNIIINDRYRLALYIFSVLLFIYTLFILFKLGQRNFELKKLIRANKNFLSKMHIQISALEATHNGIVITDNNGTIIWVNSAYTKLTGYSEKEAIGKNPRILKSNLQTSSYYKDLWDTITAGHVWHGELINRRKDNTTYTEEQTITPVLNSHGVITHFVAVKQDITGRKERETTLYQVIRALRVLSHTNKALLHAADESSLITEICHILVDRGNYRFAWVGIPEQDEAHSVKPLTQAGIGETYLQSLNISWADNKYGQGPTGIAIRTEKISVFKNITTDPRYTPWREAALKQGYASSIALPIIIQNKIWGVLNIYSSYIDAFDKEEVNLLQELTQNLGFGMDSLRTKTEHSKLQFQLQQAQKMESLGQLTGGISHDFNNILSSIMGYTSLALSRYVDDKESKLANYLQEVYRAGERARDLISQMLAFSRGGRAEARPLDAKPLLKEVMKMLESTFPASIQISTDIENELPNINFDPVQLHQIIMNICVNARDAMDSRGHLTVALRKKHIDKAYCGSCHNEFSGDFLDLSVSDTGGGISPEILTRIFDPFFTTKEVNKGTGIGLSTVHGITHEHGGHIMIDTSATNGTTFHILLPIIEVDSGQTINEQFLLETLSTQQISANILIVDDNESVSGFIAELLESYSCTVTVKYDGTQALEIFKSKPDMFDLVITDQTMSIMNGDELTKQLLSIRPDLPVILCTGNSQEINETQARDIGIKVFMAKPIDPRELLTHISTLLA